MNENLRSLVLNYVENNQKQLKELFVDLLGKMVKEPTVNVVESKLSQFPFLKERGEETRVSKIVKEFADKEGFAYEIHARIPERENIILHFGEKKGKALLVPSHMDVVPAGDGWNTDPFIMKVDGDTVYGRGVIDDKGPLAATLVALKILKECRIAITGDLQIAAVADEEAKGEDGLDYGIEYLLEKGAIKADFSIVPDIGGEMMNIDVAEKGRVVYEVKATGKQAHGASPEKGINAINSMAEFLVRLKNHAFKYDRHPVLGSYSVNVGEIKGGAAPNIVPGSCTTSVDMRLVPGQEPESVRLELEGLAKGLEAAFEVQTKAASLPHGVDPNNSILVKTIQEVSEKIRGKKPMPMGMGGGTYAKSLNNNGIEAVGFATGNDDAFHLANEFASITEHLDYAKVIAVVAMELLGAEKK